MNSKLFIAVLTAIAGLTSRADKIEDKIAANFFNPEQVRKHAEILNLTEEQKTTLKDAYEHAQAKVEGIKQRLQEEADKFNDLTKGGRIDEKALFDQGDKLLSIDREMKHAQLKLLVLIKNTLTTEQQATLNAIKALEPKMKEARQLADKWQADGRDLSKLETMKSEFETALQSGKIKEAEALMDKALAILHEGK